MKPRGTDQYGEQDPEAGESLRKKFVMDEFSAVPVGKEAENIRRTRGVLLNDGRETTLNLSASECIARDGWDDEAVKYAKVGTKLSHLYGGVYEVTKIEKGRIHVRNLEEGDPGYISTTPKNIKADEYRFRLQDSLGKAKEIKVYDTIFKDKSLRVKEFLNDLVGAIPAQHLNAIEEIRLDLLTGSKEGKFRMESSLLGKNGIVTLYLAPELFEDDETFSVALFLSTFYHELGHAIANAIRGTAHPGPRWTTMMKRDGNQMSEYAAITRSKSVKNDEGEVEDFAEAVSLYLSTDGARGPKYSRLREACRNRFEYLDDLFENPVHQEVMNTNRLLRRVLGKQIP